LGRLQALERFAPRLLEISRGLPGLAERLLSGEVVEPMRVTRADPDLVRSAWWGEVAAGILEPQGPPLGQRLSDVADAVAQVTWIFDPAHSAVIALGSWGGQDLLTTSDLDALVWFDADVPTEEAEAAVTQWLRAWSDLPIKIDLRLRPEGRFGRLATRASALEVYAAQHLEPWERFALGRSRLVVGSSAGLQQVRALAYPGVWEADMRAQLGQMKLRIERERSAGASDLKLGAGGSDDFAWLLGIGLLALGAEAQGVAADAESRLAAMVQAGILSGATAHELLVAHQRGMAVRQWRALSEDPDESWPPAPAKLEALAEWQGFGSVSLLLKSHAEDRARVRAEWEAMQAKVLT
jgi:glutamate-ammonia-ligase adenylyltransferase